MSFLWKRFSLYWYFVSLGRTLQNKLVPRQPTETDGSLRTKSIKPKHYSFAFEFSQRLYIDYDYIRPGSTVVPFLIP